MILIAVLQSWGFSLTGLIATGQRPLMGNRRVIYFLICMLNLLPPPMIVLNVKLLLGPRILEPLGEEYNKDSLKAYFLGWKYASL